MSNVLMTCMLHRPKLPTAHSLVDLLQENRVVWHGTNTDVPLQPDDFLTPASQPNEAVTCTIRVQP